MRRRRREGRQAKQSRGESPKREKATIQVIQLPP